MISQPISTRTPQDYHHLHLITYTFSETPHFSKETLGHLISPLKARYSGPEGSEKNSSEI